LLSSYILWLSYNFISFDIVNAQVYSQEDISKMPLELGNALSHERESVDDPEIRKQALEAIYLISLQVKSLNVHM